jgi:hypothetical protein
MHYVEDLEIVDAGFEEPLSLIKGRYSARSLNGDHGAMLTVGEPRKRRDVRESLGRSRCLHPRLSRIRDTTQQVLEQIDAGEYAFVLRRPQDQRWMQGLVIGSPRGAGAAARR